MKADLSSTERLRPEFAPVQPRVDNYEIRSFTEESDPELAQLAWAIHATGYMNMHLVKPNAVDPDSGQLGDGIDKSRGPSVEYRLAIKPDENAHAVLAALKTGDAELPDVGLLNAATMRKVHIPYGGTIEDLPAYQLCKENLYPWGEEYLRGIENPQDRIKEIAALTPTQRKSKMGVYELIRDAIQDAQGKNEIWICSIVSTTNNAFSEGFGPGVMMQIGEQLAIDDPRVSDDIKLVPVAIDIDALISSNYDNYKAAIDPVSREKRRRSFMFFSEGLGEEKLGSRLASARQEMLQEKETGK